MTGISPGWLVAHHYSTRNLLVIGFWKSPFQNVTYEFWDHLLKFFWDCIFFFFFHSLPLSLSFSCIFLVRNFRSCWSCRFWCHWPAFLFVWWLMNPWGEVSASLMEARKQSRWEWQFLDAWFFWKIGSWSGEQGLNDLCFYAQLQIKLDYILTYIGEKAITALGLSVINF